MRGVVTAGMVTGLEMLGLKDVFDSVYARLMAPISSRVRQDTA